MTRYTNEQLIKILKERHSVDYGFDNIKPFPVDKKELVLNCPVHGEFTKKISLLLRGVGCNICSQINKGKKSQSNTEEFIKKAKKIHKNKYNYSKTNYTKSGEKLTIICPIHGDFQQRANDHLNGKGCSKCGYANLNNGWNYTTFKNQCSKYDDNAIFYVIKCYDEEEQFYKIGITSRSIQKRYGTKREMPYKYEIIQEIKTNSLIAFKLEKFFLKKSKNFKYCPKIHFRGAHECIKFK